MTPFKLIEGDTPEALLARISQTKINFDEGNWKHISYEAKVMPWNCIIHFIITRLNLNSIL